MKVRMTWISFITASLLLVCVGFFGTGLFAEERRKIDYSEFKTFGWMPEGVIAASHLTPIDSQIHSLIVSAVNRELEQKGMKEVPTLDQADLVIVYTLDIQQKKNVIASGYGMGPQYFGAGANIDRYGNVKSHPVGFGSDKDFEVYYREGKLILDFYDGKTRALVWRGTGVKTIQEKADLKQREKNITKEIGKILKDFPPEQ